LKEIAHQTLKGDTQFTEIDHQNGLYVLAIPLIYRQQVVGVLMACALSHDFMDQENIARFCSLHQMDRWVTEKLIEPLPRYSVENLHAYSDILGGHTESLINSTLVHNDVLDMSGHLARVYEELSLIFRIGTDIVVSEGPTAYFEKLGEELLEATVFENIAIVLDSPVELFSRPMTFKAGPLEVDDEQLTTFYHQVRHQTRNFGKALVVNHIDSDSDLKWSSNWIKRFIFYEFTSNSHTFGGIFAINSVDSKDFGTEEMQLLNTIVERSSSFLENVRLYTNLEQLMMGMMHALVNSIDAKDPYTCGHSQRVASLSRHIAGLDGKSNQECQRIYISGLLHDIGKIGISETVLRKTGKLTAEEYEQMKRHTTIGARIITGVRQVEDLIPGILCHHERIDGKGYPGGLKGDEIPYFGRIIGLADSFDAMISDRTYRNARPIPAVITEIRRYAGTQFDPALADLLLGEDMTEILRVMDDSGKQPLVSYQASI
jgi:HD-GYP domain-containing protein (c-di-GMP phosphodiesterase class II)